MLIEKSFEKLNSHVYLSLIISFSLQNLLNTLLLTNWIWDDGKLWKKVLWLKFYNYVNNIILFYFIEFATEMNVWKWLVKKNIIFSRKLKKTSIVINTFIKINIINYSLFVTNHNNIIFCLFFYNNMNF